MFKYILIIFCLLLVVPCSSQVRRKKLQKCELIFKDSTSFVGFCKIVKADRIEFAMEQDSVPDLWDAKDVKSVRLFRSDQDLVLEYFNVRKGMARLLEIREYGDVMLYTRTKKIPFLLRNHEGENEFVDKKDKEYSVNYYLKRASSDKFLSIRPSWSNRKWKKMMLEFFKDCPLLVEDLQEDAYDKESILQLVRDYNVYCVD